MYEQCKLFYDIIFRTEKVKVGRGKNAKFVEQRVYGAEEEVERRAIDSLEYYKKKMENPSKIKYR